MAPVKISRSTSLDSDKIPPGLESGAQSVELGPCFGSGDVTRQSSSDWVNAPEVDLVDGHLGTQATCDRACDLVVGGLDVVLNDSPCPVCFEVEEHHVHLACGHELCVGCFAEYVVIEVKDGRARRGEVRCPLPNCPVPVVDGAFAGFLATEDLARHERLKAAQKIEDDPRMSWCPHPGCDSVLQLTQGRSPAHCGSCGTRICVRCKAKHHPLQTCSMASNSTYGRWKSGRRGKVKRCPQCKHHIEKDGGCRHMTCSSCQHEFCWVCKGQWVRGRCQSRMRCQAMKILGARLWGRSRAERAAKKTAAALLVVPIATTGVAVTACMALVGVSVFMVSLAAYGPVFFIKRARSRRADELLERSLKARSILFGGVHLTLVGFPDGLLKKVSDDIEGRWRGRGSNLALRSIEGSPDSALVTFTRPSFEGKGAEQLQELMEEAQEVLDEAEEALEDLPRFVLVRAGVEAPQAAGPDVHVFEVSHARPGESPRVAYVSREPRRGRGGRQERRGEGADPFAQSVSPIEDAHALMGALYQAALLVV